MDDEMLGKLVNFVMFVNGEKRMSFFGTVDTWANRGYRIDSKHGNVCFMSNEVAVIDSNTPEVQMHVEVVSDEEG